MKQESGYIVLLHQINMNTVLEDAKTMCLLSRSPDGYAVILSGNANELQISAWDNKYGTCPSRKSVNIKKVLSDWYPEDYTLSVH